MNVCKVWNCKVYYGVQPRNASHFSVWCCHGQQGEFRRLRTATKGAALWNPATGSALSIPATFEKVDETFIPGYFFTDWS